MGQDDKTFREVWFVDFEFRAIPGSCPAPICLVARELHSGKRIRIWQDELQRLTAPPYPTSEDTLLVAYYGSAEVGCHLALGWPPPENLLDLYTEFRCLTNGRRTPCGSGLIGALAWFGLDSIGSVEKDRMRELALRGGPWTDTERGELLDYCESDVSALLLLLERMKPGLDMPRALLRGRYMAAAASIEHNGIPIDLTVLSQLRQYWPTIQDELIRQVDKAYGVYHGRSFNESRFASWLTSRGIPWPRLPSGRLELSDDAFREMARIHREISPLRELRVALGQLRLAKLAVGPDGRNRCLLSAFRARTGRNQPSNSEFIFGPAVWMRHLIRPKPGYGVVYIDWAQQEFGIAAALSGDTKMQAAYLSGDPYLEFAKQAGAAPTHATKASHGLIREQFKACALAVQYGMGPDSLAQRINQPVAAARELLRLHFETYHVFWEWSDACVDFAMLHGQIWTVFGWKLHIASDPNPRSLRNFPMQANGAEMLRLACCMATEAGIRICAPVHDAILIEAPLEQLDDAVEQTQKIMAEASRIVLGGFELRSDARAFRYPDHFADERGTDMWNTVLRVLEEIQFVSKNEHPSEHQRTGGVASTLTRPILSMSSQNKEGPAG